MTITRRWQSGFETNSMAEISYVSDATISSTVAKTGTYSLRIPTSYDKYAYKNITATRQVRIGFFVYFDGLRTAEQSFLVLDDASSNHLVKLESNSTSLILEVGGTNRDTEVGAVAATTWMHYGIDAKIDSSSGWVKVYKDGIEVLSYTGNTGNADITKVLFIDLVGANPNIFYYFDDCYINDATGETSASALNIKRFYHVVPNDNGGYSQWDGSDGNSVDNYALVDEIAPSESDYVTNTAADEYDAYAMGTITLGVGQTCAAVIPMAYVKRSGTTEQIAIGTRLSGTDDDGSDQSPGTSSAFLWERKTAKPGTGAWDQTALDGFQVLLKSRGTY